MQELIYTTCVGVGHETNVPSPTQRAALHNNGYKMPMLRTVVILALLPVPPFKDSLLAVI